MAISNSKKPFRFLDLPAEIREQVRNFRGFGFVLAFPHPQTQETHLYHDTNRSQIYSHVLHPSSFREDLGEGYGRYNYNLSLFRVSHLVYTESLKIFRQLNFFVMVETPWREAERHVSIEGNVPIICRGKAAEHFTDHTLAVNIDAPDFHMVDEGENKRFIILLDDLVLFCRMWYYSDLNYAGDLNRYLTLTMTLRQPFAAPYDDTTLSKALQRRIFEPFGLVKGLNDVVVKGKHCQSLEQSMKEEMAIPYDTPQKCLEEANKLKEEGNKALKTNNPKRAIELYIQSFEKIHIVCIGRRRSIWGDAWFDVQLTHDPYKDQHGQVVRLILRVALVANIVKAYLDMQDYDEARFWGMRTIDLMREASGWDSNEEQDEPVLSFPGAPQIGKIYYRTGVALKALGERGEARKLLKIAAEYLPHDETVKRELASVSLRIG